jgi:hypothetical protein
MDYFPQYVVFRFCVDKAENPEDLIHPLIEIQKAPKISKRNRANDCKNIHGKLFDLLNSVDYI